jgi:serine/threonine protein kinase
MIECLSCGFINADEAHQCRKCTSPLLSRDLRCGLYTYGGTSKGQVLQMRYAITRELSSDVTGVKYLAEDVEEKKDVIIWALPIVAGEDEEKIRSLSELCNNLKELTDEHILNVSGFYPEKNVRYAVTEYVDGCSLGERVASEGPLNIETVLAIFGPIARSLDIVHKQGFIHGDISPANILISSKGVVKLANFAIGRAIKEMLARLLPEEDIKPSFYTAPEQLENEICSAQSDIYSLAACIYQSLSEEPFSRLDQRQLQELKHKLRRLVNLSDKQNEVLRRSLSANPQFRHNSAVELLTELRDSAAGIDVVKAPTISEHISYEKSLADFKQKTQDWNRKLEEGINKLITVAEREKQKHAEMLRQAQTQARQLAEQLRADYEGKTEQLKAKIEEAQAELTTAVSEANRKTEALVSEKEKALQQSREHEEAINKLIADAEQEKQKHAEMLSKARAQVREQDEQQLADYEGKIVQLKAKIADTELAAAAALGQTNRNTEALAAEKEKALQRSKELEEAVNKLKADAEQEKQKHSELLSKARVKVREQAEQQLVDYEGKIKQHEAKITETQAKLAATVSEADRNTKALNAEKEKALQQSKDHEDAIKKLTVDAEKEKQILAEALSRAQTQAREQAEQQQADYERKINQLEAKIAEAEAKLAAAVSEVDRNTEALAAEKKKVLQQSRELEEAVNKLKADAEHEKQKHSELLSEAQAQVSKQAEHQLVNYEGKIKQLEAKITETEAKLAAAVSESHRNSEALAAERKKALQQSREYEETLKKVSAEAQQQQKKSAEQLNQAQRKLEAQTEAMKHIKKETADTSSRSKISIIAWASVSIVILGVVTSYLYVKAEKQNKHSLKQGMTGLSSAKQGEYKASTDLTGSKIKNDIVEKRPAKTKAERTGPRKTFSQLYREAVLLEGNNQWEKAIAIYEKALEINKNPRVENRIKMCWYNLCLSQAIKARQADDLDKAVELYGKALTYNENADVRRELDALRQIRQLQTISQEWLEPASDFEQ